MKKVLLITAVMLLAMSMANADYTTGFEASQGFTADATLDGVDGWSVYAGYDSRGKAWDAASPGTIVGDQYARIYGAGFNATSSAGFNRLLGADERLGDGRANEWTVNASVWMSTASTDSNFGFGGIYLSDSDGTDAVVAGFNNDKFAYFNGTTLVTSAYTFSANAWYLFEFTIKCGGSGVGDVYDMKVSGVDGTEVFSVEGKYFRHSGNVDYINNIKLFSSRANANVAGWDATGSMYYDQISLSVPEPATMSLLGLGGVLTLFKRGK